ncbi:hypothetical protein [Alicyclobacillus suci]|uniref:hypothetical protein n=1 Tax=Alicyclobacillus suci TaxID=2816080 RepID=UPI002E2C21DE|nr:hypothetical protein [Alicyclobacillus suci]
MLQRTRRYRGKIPPYSIQNQLTQGIRKAAAQQGDFDYMSLWAGQGLWLATSRPAEEIVRETIAQAQGVR